MKRKPYKTGVKLTMLFCSACSVQNISIGKGLYDRFYADVAEMMSVLQSLHDDNKPVACNGKLDVTFVNKVTETD